MGWLRRLRGTIVGSSREDSLADEVRFHLDERTDELVRRGMARQEARREALRRFGSVAFAKDQARDVDTLAWLRDLGRDVRRAARGLRKNPSFATTAIVSLALGVFELLARGPDGAGLPEPGGADERRSELDRGGA